MVSLVLNPKQLEADIATIKSHVEEMNNLAVFIEVTNSNVTSQFTKYFSALFIDPQHTVTGRGGLPELLKRPNEFTDMSAIKWTLKNWEYLAEIFEGRNILYVLEKADMDAVGTLTLCWWMEEGIKKFPLNEAEVQRIMDIHQIDSFIQPNEWNPDHYQDQTIKWTNILGACISDFTIPIGSRVAVMEEFLLEGYLPEFYRTQVEKEWFLLKQATVETISGITVVTSEARGAANLVYKQAPFGIAYCENFNGKGVKFSVMEFKAGYLQLHDQPEVKNADGNITVEFKQGFYSYMNENYPETSGTWGGGATAGGSPIPCSLSKETVAAELAKFVK